MLDHVSRLGDPPQLRVTSCEISKSLRMARVLLARNEEFWQSLIETTTEKMREADQTKRGADAGSRTEADGSLQMFARVFELACITLRFPLRCQPRA